MASEEERTRENERPQLGTVTLEHAPVGSTVLKRTVGVVDVSVKHVGAVRLDMLELDRHRLERPVEDARVVNVVPGVEEVVSAFKLGELVDPEVLSIRVQEVHEGGVPGPSLNIQRLAVLVTHEDVLGVAFCPLGVL